MQIRVLCTVESRDRRWCHSVTYFNDSARLEVDEPQERLFKDMIAYEYWYV